MIMPETHFLLRDDQFSAVMKRTLGHKGGSAIWGLSASNVVLLVKSLGLKVPTGLTVDVSLQVNGIYLAGGDDDLEAWVAMAKGLQDAFDAPP